MIALPFLARLWRDQRAATAVEFALVGPALLVMVFGVLQVGLAMQNFNALRNVSADVARYAMVQHQTGNTVTNSQIRLYALGRAQGPPYLLSGARLNASVLTAAPQRVEGAVELKITLNYQIDSILEFAGVGGPFISYERPIFLLDNS